ncbi:hypothetical protein N7532_009336 [Penicillium argentinense]|uniref:FAD-binding PCMH-type domain-containing protein n=1 Tax=Penicillium argentinense TaxID=1131581 RepID=A0A9W9EZ68_9EURO|nr:uncharacterized protein N7532_009336 [Penicillium argentinense]KAJ5090652.1 hypothetical protein N7532_009336 [Penicillium argentinense]
MGNAPSIPGHDCLLAAVAYNPSKIAFRGSLRITPLYNLDFPVVPTAITYPDTNEQVAEIVRCAADNGYKVQARSGGHSYGNYGLGGTDGAIVVDLQNFQQFSIDPNTQIATIGAGTLLRDLTTRLNDAGGRAVAHGTCGQVGTGGHFTIGGLGPKSREWGMALDHVEEATVVLANSTIVQATKDQHQDVLFAIKGAAASFGIVTEFKLHTHPAPTQAYQYSFTWTMGSSRDKANVFKDWQRLVSNETLTRKFASELVVTEAGVIVSGTYFGTREEFDAFELENHFPMASSSTVLTLSNWLGMIGSRAEDLIEQAAGGIPVSFYSKSLPFTNATIIPDEGVDALFEYIDKTPKDTLAWFIIFDLEAGATNDVPMDATAYAHRDAFMWMQSYAINLLGPVSRQSKNFLQGLNDVILRSEKPGARFGAYPGYVDPYMENAQYAYWGSNLPRLETIKRDIDPNDVFHNPQSVRVKSNNP